ncbi:MAG: toxin-activating lysine-acyltransferase [Alphaproteobacteria bacterium]
MPREHVSFVTWACLTDDLETSFSLRAKKIEPGDWTGGHKVWCVYFVAPFGHAKSILSLLRNGLFPTFGAKAQRLRKIRNGPRTIALRGVNCAFS